jgi:hypothetical protein
VLGAARLVRERRGTGDERGLLSPRIVATYSGYQAYQAKTSGEIPLAMLEA